MSRTFAYARVSTIEQETENQIAEIKAAGFAVERLFKGQVETGIARGLQDVAAGRYSEMTPTHLGTMRAKFKGQTS